MMHDSKQITKSTAAEENDGLISETLASIPNSRSTSLEDTKQDHSSDQPHAADILKAPTKIIRKNGRSYIHCEPCSCFCKVSELHSINFKIPAVSKQNETIFSDEILQSYLKLKGPLEVIKAQLIVSLPTLQTSTPKRKALADGQL